MANYRNLKVWQKAHQLTLSIYAVTRVFPRDEVYGLTSQMRRASVSVPANIAEGRGRYTDGEFGRFVQIALGSAAELDYLLLLAHDLTYVTEVEHQRLAAELDEIQAMLIALSQKLTPQSSRLTAKKAGTTPIW